MEKNNQYVSIAHCDGVKSGGIHLDLECCLQSCAEDIFGEVPDDDSEHFETWRIIEKTLVEEGFIRFEDGSIQIAEVFS